MWNLDSVSRRQQDTTATEKQDSQDKAKQQQDIRNATVNNDDEYFAKERGTQCEADNTITSQEECKKAAALLGFGRQPAEVRVDSFTRLPQGCFVGFPDGWRDVYFNTNFDGRRTSSDNVKPICRRTAQGKTDVTEEETEETSK